MEDKYRSIKKCFIIVLMIFCVFSPPILGWAQNCNPVELKDIPTLSNQITIKLGNAYYSRWQPQTQLCERFAELVAIYSQNRIKVVIYGSGTLGDETGLVKAVRLGSVQMASVAINNMTPFASSVGFYTLPYIVSNNRELYAIQDKTTDWLNEKVIKEADVRILGWANSGWRYIFNSKHPVKTPDDLKGLKMRVPKNAMMIDIYKAWGITPVPLAWGEMFSALQQKVVDGGDNPINEIVGTKFYEVTKYITRINYNNLSLPIFISEKFFQAQTPEIQTILKRAGKEATEYSRWWSAIDLEKTLWPKIRDAKLVVIDPDDEKPWKERAMTVWPKYEGEVGGKAVLSEIEKIKKDVK